MINNEIKNSYPGFSDNSFLIYVPFPSLDADIQNSVIADETSLIMFCISEIGGINPILSSANSIVKP
jgi:hypothetical protein